MTGRLDPTTAPPGCSTGFEANVFTTTRNHLEFDVVAAVSQVIDDPASPS